MDHWDFSCLNAFHVSGYMYLSTLKIAANTCTSSSVALLWLWEHPRQGKPEVEVSLEAAPPTPASLLFSWDNSEPHVVLHWLPGLSKGVELQLPTMVTVSTTHPPSIPAASPILLQLFPGVMSQTIAFKSLSRNLFLQGSKPNNLSFLFHFGPYATCLQLVELLILEVLSDSHLCDALFIYHTPPSSVRASFPEVLGPLYRLLLQCATTWW